MRIITIVVTYNGEQYISKCLQSLRDSTLQTEVVVVDNASSDKTIDIIQKEFPECKLYLQNKNLGFGTANNIGMRYTIEQEADYVFLLNQDARVEPETIGELLAISINHPQIGILSPFHYYQNDVPERFFQMFLDEGIAKYGKQDELQTVDFVDAAIWLIPRFVMMRVGLFSPLFYHYGEDDNYCDRTLFYNFKIVIAIHVKAYHQSTQVICFPKGHLFYLIKRFKLKLLIYLSNPNAKLISELKRLLFEIFNTPVAGRFKGFLYRIITAIFVAIYYLKMKRQIRNYRKESKVEGAFLI